MDKTDAEWRAMIIRLGWLEAPPGKVDKVRLTWRTQSRWVRVDGRWFFAPNDQDHDEWKPSLYGPD